MTVFVAEEHLAATREQIEQDSPSRHVRYLTWPGVTTVIPTDFLSNWRTPRSLGDVFILGTDLLLLILQLPWMGTPEVPTTEVIKRELCTRCRVLIIDPFEFHFSGTASHF